MKKIWVSLVFLLGLFLAFMAGAFLVWANKPLDTPLWCAQKGMDALIAVARVTVEQMENWIIGIGGILVLIPLYGIWRVLAMQKRPNQRAEIAPIADKEPY